MRLRGRARVLERGEEAERALALLAAKYEQYEREPPGVPVLAIDVDRVAVLVRLVLRDVRHLRVRRLDEIVLSEPDRLVVVPRLDDEHVALEEPAVDHDVVVRRPPIGGTAPRSNSP